MMSSMPRKISLIVSILFLFGCGGASGLDPFPASFVYVVKIDKQRCSKHAIISKNPVKVDKGVFIPWSECPDVIGFDYQESASIFNWIRKAEKTASERCK